LLILREEFAASSLLSYCMGICFGRWDIRIPIEESKAINFSGAFEPFRACSPGMLKNDSDIPIDKNSAPENYPIDINWGGILVDDEGQNEDIIKRIINIIELIWTNQSEDIEQKTCLHLRFKSLREYFRSPNGFFLNHLKRYTKTKRQAPIYWPISTASCTYTLWLYYPRLTNQTLYTCVNDFVEPKLKQVSEAENELQRKIKRTREDETELEKLSNLKMELKDFFDELLRIANFWDPNLNDGVQITAAPLWKLFQYGPWKKKMKETWEKLEKGDYDWSHLAYSIWPDRVILASHKDRSYAIAHDLEYDLWEEFEDGTDRQGNLKYKWAPKKITESEMKQLIKRKMKEQ